MRSPSRPVTNPDDGWVIQPMPLVRIATRRHVPVDPTRTRLGIGERFLDQAAGISYRDRAPNPAGRAGFPSGGARAPAAAAGYSAMDREPAPSPRFGWNAVEAPVHLPMRARSAILLPAILLFILFTVTCVSIGLTGSSSTPKPSPSPGSRVDFVPGAAH